MAIAAIGIPTSSAEAQAVSCAGLAVTIDMNSNGGNGTGTSGDDVILGTAGPDTINGGAGNDTICGQGDRDTIHGGTGNDLIYGGGGHDVLNGGPGADTIYGQPGADTIRGNGGPDTLLGGTGYDTLEGGAGDDFIQGSGGNDTLRGGDGNDALFGKAGDDNMFGEAGDDELYAAGGNDLLDGGAGKDRLQGASGNDELQGGPDDDTLYGQAGNDTLRGGDGNDEVYGAAGHDRLFGGDGNDRLQGAAGDDYIEAGAGDDILFGQSGSDEVNGGAGTDECYGAERSRNCEARALPLAGEVVHITGPERSDEEWEAIEAAMVPFEQATGATVVYTGSANWQAEIEIQVATGSAPDISIFPTPNSLATFARRGVLRPLTESARMVAAENWASTYTRLGLVDNSYYGMPVKTDLKSLVWFKPGVFAARGYAVPRTWDELVALSNTMIADGITPWCVGIESGGATGWVFTDWVEDRLLGELGPDAYDDWVANDLKFSSPQVRAVIQEVLNLWNTPGAVLGSAASISSTHFATGPAEGLAADNCAMVRQATFFASFYPGDQSELDVFAFPANAANEQPIVGGGNLAGAFNDRAATWAAMEYLGSPEYANARQLAQRANRGGGISGFNTANLNAEASFWSPFGQRFLMILQDAEVFRFDGSDLMPDSVAFGEFWVQSTAMVDGRTTVAAGAAAIDAAWPQ